MKTSLLRLLCCCVIGWCAVVRMASAQSLTVAASESRCSVQGGTVAFDVVLNYAGKSPTGLGLEMLLPAGWSHQTTFGINQPEIGPQAGETGSLGWAFVAIPAGAAKFSFVVSYRAGLTGPQTFEARPVFRPVPERTVGAQKIVVEAP